MQVEQVREAAAPALPDRDGGVQGRHTALGDAHDADPGRIDPGIAAEEGEGRESVALHLGGRNQALVGHCAPHAAAPETVDDQRGRAGLVEKVGVVMLAMALHTGAAGEDDHAGDPRRPALGNMQGRGNSRRPRGRRMVERQRVE